MGLTDLSHGQSFHHHNSPKSPFGHFTQPSKMMSLSPRRAKRRLSNSHPTPKRCKQAQPLIQSTPTKYVPHHEHRMTFNSAEEEGACIEQTPYGMVKQSEIESHFSVEQDNVFGSFNTQRYGVNGAPHGQGCHDQETDIVNKHRLNQQGYRGQHHSQNSSMRMESSPSLEIEEYMMEGYHIETKARNVCANDGLNKSYRYHEEKILNVNYGLYDADFNECDNDDEDLDYEIY